MKPITSVLLIEEVANVLKFNMARMPKDKLSCTYQEMTRSNKDGMLFM
jgi:hypothetical protein